MPRSVRGLGTDVRGETKKGGFLKQESYLFKGDQSSSRLGRREEEEEEQEEDDAAISLIKTCEAWATEAFRLPADFLHSLSQPGKKKRWVMWVTA